MNNPLVSVIVPTYNSGSYLEACLKSIVNQSYKNLELIVVDNNSTDDTKEVAQKYTNSVYNIGPERSAQRNYGFKQSQGEYILMIDSDMELSENVVKACVEKILSNSLLRTLTIHEESFGETFWAECKKLERSFYQGVSWQEGTRFFERKTYEDIGGYDESFTGWEDYDLPNRIEYKYGRECVGSIDDLIYHNERKLSLVKLCSKRFYYSQAFSIYVQKEANKLRWSKQTSLIYRYGLFLSRPGKLFKNPVLGIGVLFMKTCEFFSGAAGFLVGILLKKDKVSDPVI